MEFEMEVEEVEAADACVTCLGTHDDGVHAATLSVRQWLRNEINRKLTTTAPDLLKAA